MRGKSRRLLILAGMLIVDVAVAALIWIYLPTTYDTTTIQLARFQPDIGILLAAGVILTFIWAPIRTVLGLIHLRAAGGGAAPHR